MSDDGLPRGMTAQDGGVTVPYGARLHAGQLPRRGQRGADLGDGLGHPAQTDQGIADIALQMADLRRLADPAVDGDGAAEQLERLGVAAGAQA